MSSFPGGEAPPSAPPGSVAPPPARRATSPGWRDPRLWIGVAIVAASVVVGARVLASADDTVEVWAVRGDVRAGEHLDGSDLVSQRVRFADADALGRYFRVDDQLPDLSVVRSLGAGELLPREAIGEATDANRAEISIEVAPGLVPTDVGPGSLVDVYLVAPHRGTPTSAALTGVTVVDAPSGSGDFAPTSARQIVLAVDDGDVAAFYGRLGALTDPDIYLVEHP